jgi:hypothetical protein
MAMEKITDDIVGDLRDQRPELRVSWHCDPISIIFMHYIGKISRSQTR